MRIGAAKVFLMRGSKVSDRIVSVQLNRAFAALLVVIAHAYNHPLSHDLNAATRAGRFGVVLFFVISGFIMVSTTGLGSFNPFTFIKRRVIRIVPYYWLMTLAVAGVALLAPSVLKTTVFSPSHLMLSLLFIPHIDPVGSKDPLLKLGWTLNYEMFFYVCFSMLFFFSARVRVFMLSCSFALLAIAGNAFRDGQEAFPRFNEAGIGFPLYSDTIILAFALGSLIGYMHLSGRLRPTRRAGVLMLTLSINLLWFALLVEPGERGGAITNAVLTLASGIIVSAGLAFEREARAFNFGRLLGDASFSIYLTHMYWIGLCSAIAFRFGIDRGIYLTVAISGALVGGIVAYRLLEQPLVRLLSGESAKPPNIEPLGPAVATLGDQLPADKRLTAPSESSKTILSSRG